MVKSINYGQNMTLQDYTVYERDSYGRTTGSTTYDTDNVKKSRMVYEYAGDEIGTKEFEEITADYRYNENDSLTNHNIYEYDENGNALRTLYYYDFVTSDSPLFYCTYVFHEFTFGDEPDIRNAVFEYYDNVAPEGTFLLYRMYNPNSGEHFWTGSKTEGTNLAEAGWIFEGPGWIAPLVGEPVYRVFNPNANDHFYTTDESEKNTLVNVGWQYEGVCWNSAPDTGKPMYRLYNPNAYDLGQSGAHHYTESIAERDDLISVGWIDEGIAWYAQ